MIIGLVGKPSSGKSTFFRAATMADVDTASYPFTTVEPNRGVAHVRVDCPEDDFGTECDPSRGFCEEGTRFVPVEVIDVAGLVPGAHEGKGLGNQFLSDLNEADALVHIVDASGTTDEEGEPTEGHDPLEDVRFLERELDLWYKDILQRHWDKITRRVEQGERTEEVIADTTSSLGADRETVKRVLRETDTGELSEWEGDEIGELASRLRRETKPIVIAANKMDLEPSAENFIRLREETSYSTVVPVMAEGELALREAVSGGLIDYTPGNREFEVTGDVSEEQRKGLEEIERYLEEYGHTGVQEVLEEAVFGVLDMVAVFPVPDSSLEDAEGRTLPDCFLVPEGTTARELAYEVHSDFGENFLHAVDLREGQKRGADHELSHRDVIEIVSAAG